MSRKYGWTLRIIPEDDRYRQIANGFIRNLPPRYQKFFEIQPIANGWKKALEAVSEQSLDRYDDRHVLVLIDYDGEGDRRQQAVDAVIGQLPRVFCLGPKDEAEDLERSLNGGAQGRTKFACGRLFASADFVCPDRIWQDAQLNTPSNSETLARLCPLLRLKVLGR